MLDAYLDGSLHGENLAAFEAELARNAELRAQVELTERLAKSLRTTFVPPVSITIPQTTGARPNDVIATLRPGTRSTLQPAQVKTPGTDRMSLVKRLALYAAVAVVALVAAVGLTIWSENRTPAPVDPSPDAMYARLVAAGFTPQWKCENDAEFRKAVDERLGQPLLLASGLPGVDVLGWAYSGKGYDGAPLTGQVMILLTKADNKDVVVFVDQKKNDVDPLMVRRSSGLHLFRREIGELVAYEVTPLAEPRIVQNFSQPDR